MAGASATLPSATRKIRRNPGPRKRPAATDPKCPSPTTLRPESGPSDAAEQNKVAKRDGPSLFTTVPVELCLDILRFLSAEDLASCACSCSFLRSVADDERLWRRAYCLRWGQRPEEGEGNHVLTRQKSTWKQAYFRRDQGDMAQFLAGVSDELRPYYAQMQGAKRATAPTQEQASAVSLRGEKTLSERVSEWRRSRNLPDPDAQAMSVRDTQALRIPDTLGAALGPPPNGRDPGPESLPSRGCGSGPSSASRLAGESSAIIGDDELEEDLLAAMAEELEEDRESQGGAREPPGGTGEPQENAPRESQGAAREPQGVGRERQGAAAAGPPGREDGHVCSGQNCTYHQIGDVFLCEQTGRAHVCGGSCNAAVIDPRSDLLVCAVSGRCFDRMVHDELEDEYAEEGGGGVGHEDDVGRLGAAFVLGYSCADEGALRCIQRSFGGA